jgi:hypothetical protein
MRKLLSIAALLALSSPVLACLNDTELISHEREFKSQYQESQYQPPAPTPVSSARPYVLGSTGILMALAGVGLLVRLRSNSR